MHQLKELLCVSGIFFFCVVAPRLPIEAGLDSAARSELESSLVNSGERRTHRRNAEGPKETDRILLSRGIVENRGHFFFLLCSMDLSDSFLLSQSFLLKQ